MLVNILTVRSLTLARIEELINGQRLFNRIASVGADGLKLVAERFITDDPTSAWKLTKINEEGQPVPNDPPFANAYTKDELINIAKFGGYEEWQAVPIDYKHGSSVVDGKGYRDEMQPRY